MATFVKGNTVVETDLKTEQAELRAGGFTEKKASKPSASPSK